MSCPREYGPVPTETEPSSGNVRKLDGELSELRSEVARLRTENARLLRLLELAPRQARPPGPTQTAGCSSPSQSRRRPRGKLARGCCGRQSPSEAG